MKKTKILALTTGAFFLMTALFSGKDSESQQARFQTLLIASSISQFTLAVMARELEKKE